MKICLLALASIPLLLIDTAAVCAQDVQPGLLTQDGGRDLLAIPVYAGNIPLRMAIDSGADPNILHLSHSNLAGARLGPIDVIFPMGRFDGHLYRSPKLTMHGRMVSDSTVAIVDLSPISDVTGTRIDGILGASFFSKHSLEILSGGSEVVFNPPRPEAFGKRLPVMIGPGGVPHVQGIEVVGVEHTFLFGLGCVDGLVVETAIFDDWVERNVIQDVREKWTGLREKIRSGKLAKAKVWGAELSGVPISTSEKNIVGLDVIRRFDTYIDLRKKEILVSVTEKTFDPFEFDRSGLHIICDGDAIVVHSVDADTPAANAGVRAGDQIKKLNGVGVHRKLIGTVRSILSHPDIAEVRLELMRSDERVGASVLLGSKVKLATQEEHGE